MKVGSHAARAREPGQAREGAAISGFSRAPWGSPAGAPRESTPRSGNVEGGRAAHFSFMLVEFLIYLLVFSTMVLLGLGVYIKVNLNIKSILNILDRKIDEFMAISFIRTEVLSKIIPPYNVNVNKNSFSFSGFSNGTSKIITYVIESEKDIFRLKRKANGEGNNVLCESTTPMHFTIDGSIVTLWIGEKEYHLYTLVKKPEVFSGFPGAFPDPQVSQARSAYRQPQQAYPPSD